MRCTCDSTTRRSIAVDRTANLHPSSASVTKESSVRHVLSNRALRMHESTAQSTHSVVRLRRTDADATCRHAPNTARWRSRATSSTARRTELRIRSNISRSRRLTAAYTRQDRTLSRPRLSACLAHNKNADRATRSSASSRAMTTRRLPIPSMTCARHACDTTRPNSISRLAANRLRDTNAFSLARLASVVDLRHSVK